VLLLPNAGFFLVFLAAGAERGRTRLHKSRNAVHSGLVLNRIIKIVSSALTVLGVIGLATLPEDWPVFVRRMGKFPILLTPNNLIIVLLLLAIAGFAWVTFQPIFTQWHRGRNKSPLRLSVTGVPGLTEKVEGEVLWINTISVENGQAKSVYGVEILLQKVALVKPIKGGFSELHYLLPLFRTNETRFDLSPGMKRYAILFRRKFDDLPDIDDNVKQTIFFGPNREKQLTKPGLYKIDLTVYARDVPPLNQSFAFGFDDQGGSMIGPWRDNIEWPWGPVTVTAGGDHPQSPQDTTQDKK
jgi:hypothetical protein